MEHTISKTLVVLIAIAFGVFLAGPFMIASGPLYPELANDQNFYLSRIQDVREGHNRSGNTYLAEYKDALPMQFLTGEYVEATILNLLSLSTSTSLVLFPLFWGPIIFLLTYLILRAVGAPRFAALAASILLLGGVYFATLMRPISPQFNLIFWLAAVWGLITLGARQTWAWVTLQSVLVGILFYLYPYYWTHLLATLGLLALFYLVHDRATAMKYVAVILGASLVGAGYVSLVLKARMLPDYQESLSRLGFIATHTPSGVIMAVGSSTLVAVVLYIAWKQRIVTCQLVVALALVVGGLVAMNQHVITGINMEFSSHYAMQIALASAFLVLAAIGAIGWWRYLEPFAMRIVTLTIVLSIAGVSIAGVYRTTAALAKESSVSDMVKLVQYLDHLPPGVVYAPEEVALVVPAYTTHDVFYARNANIAFMPDAEVMDRFIIQNFGASLDADFIASHEREIFGHHYINRYQHALQKQKYLKLIGVHSALPERIDAHIVSAVMTRADELQSKTFAEALTPYRVDYVVLDTTAPDQLVPDNLGPHELMTIIGSFAIYALP